MDNVIKLAWLRRPPDASGIRSGMRRRGGPRDLRRYAAWLCTRRKSDVFERVVRCEEGSKELQNQQNLPIIAPGISGRLRLGYG
ncbi:MAG: hypothetical protein WDN01_22385 [Rhizomicrobium sp.]